MSNKTLEQEVGTYLYDRGHDDSMDLITDITKLIQQRELEARIDEVKALAKLACKYDEHDPIADLDPWAVPYSTVNNRLTELQAQIQENTPEDNK